MKPAARTKPKRKSIEAFAIAPAQAATKAQSFAARRPFVVLGKMRKLAAWRQMRGMPINLQNWLRVIAAELAEVNSANLMHWGSRIGLDALEAGLAHEIASTERQRREMLAHNGRHGRPFPAKTLGELLDLVTDQRDEVKFWLAIAIDETREEGRKRRAKESAAKIRQDPELMRMAAAKKRKRQAQDRKRKKAQRRAEGRLPRKQYEAKSYSNQKPWEHFGWSRRTWERKGKPEPGTPAHDASVSAVASVSPKELKRMQNRSTPSDPVDETSTYLGRVGGDSDVRSQAPVTVSVHPPSAPVIKHVRGGVTPTTPTTKGGGWRCHSGSLLAGAFVRAEALHG